MIYFSYAQKQRMYALIAKCFPKKLKKVNKKVKFKNLFKKSMVEESPNFQMQLRLRGSSFLNYWPNRIIIFSRFGLQRREKVIKLYNKRMNMLSPYDAIQSEAVSFNKLYFKKKLKFFSTIYKYRQFYMFIYFFLKKILLTKLINASMHIGLKKNFYKKNFLNYALGLRGCDIIIDLKHTLVMYRQFLFFLVHLLSSNGKCFIFSKTIIPEILFEFLFSIEDSVLLGMSFGGLLTNKKHICSKIQIMKKNGLTSKVSTLTHFFDSNFNYNLHFRDVPLIYNYEFQRNYLYNYKLPSCLILFDLDTHLVLEGHKLKLPIFGVSNTNNDLGFLTYPLLSNTYSIFALYTILIFLNKIIHFGLYLKKLKYKIYLFISYLKNKSVIVKFDKFYKKRFKILFQLNKVFRENFINKREKLGIQRKLKKQRVKIKRIFSTNFSKFAKINTNILEKKRYLKNRRKIKYLNLKKLKLQLKFNKKFFKLTKKFKKTLYWI